MPVPRTSPARTPIGRWLQQPEADALLTPDRHEQEPWHRVMWLTGIDYFSTLGYQPGIALVAAGALSPIATLILVGVTLACALPTYAEVAQRSYTGQGSIAMLENVLGGWKSKVLVLTLIGFAATDFIITITLSAADAALHIAENPLLHGALGHSQFSLTLVLITLLAAVFLKGFSEAIGLATLIAVPYLLLNLVVLLGGFAEIITHPEALDGWSRALTSQGDWTHILVVSTLVFPKLALGMSGFETGVSVMPFVAGGRQDAHRGGPPAGRIKNTRKLLRTAALIMSAFLVMSSFVTALLIEPAAYAAGGTASGRALSYLAHRLLGSGVGSLYDASTILVLWFAGASAMAGMLNLIPRYLPRFGMSPGWVAFRRPLVIALFFIAVVVTWLFGADVEAQGSAYATGVLALMLSASVAVALAFREEGALSAASRSISRRKSLYFWGVTAVFTYTLIDNVIMKPDGLLIAGGFILAVLTLGALSRSQRSLDLRVADVVLEDEHSAKIWARIREKRVHLVPLASPAENRRSLKAAELRRHYKFAGPIAFVNVKLVDDRSEFLSDLRIRATEDAAGDVLLVVKGASAIANTIAYISELLNPISIFIGLTRANLMTQAFRYLLLGEGENGLLVYGILLRYWKWTPEDDIRPLIFLMSE